MIAGNTDGKSLAMTRYRIHGRDMGEDVTKVFEAESGDEAKKMAHAIGLDVIAVEVLDDAPSAEDPGAQRQAANVGPSPLTDTPVDPRDLPEKEIWQGSPSQWTNFWWYVLCILIIPIPWAVWKMISTAKQNYAITTQRLTLETGVFKRELEEIELYRIKDTQLTRTFIQRLLKLGTVTVVSSDESMPRLVIPWIHSPANVRQHLRENVELVRRARGVRELDMN